MNWFRKKNRESENPETRDLDTRKSGNPGQKSTDTRLPGSSSPGSPAPRMPFNYFLLLFLAFCAGVVLLKPGFLQSAAVTSTQTNWQVETSGATATLPVAASYNVYDSKDAGITAGTDIKLQSTVYTTTDDGAVSCTADGGTVTCPGTIGGDFDNGNVTDNTAVSGTGTAASVRLLFVWVCGDTIQDVDGNTYNTVLIGTQCWMKENLKVGTQITDTIEMTNNAVTEKYCYANTASNCTDEGGLYEWDEIMGYSTTPGIQGICPTGWHLPTDAEYKTLEVYLGMSQAQADAESSWRGTTEGDEMKKTGLCEGRSPCGTSGLDSLLVGRREIGGGSSLRGTYAYFWSSSANGSFSWARGLYLSAGTVHRIADYRTLGYAVRCLKN